MTDALSNRRRGFVLLASLVILIAFACGSYWFMHARYFETTDDAYVASDIVQITSETSGTVLAVNVDDTQSVKQGQALLELDTADAEVALTAAEAELARTVRQVRALYAQHDQLRALIDERHSELARAQSDYKRRQSLQKDGAVSAEEIAHARDTIAELSANLNNAQQQLRAVQVQTERTTVTTHPQVLAAAAQARNAALTLKRTHIAAPVGGVIAKRNVQPGQTIAAGMPLMAIVPLENAWVDANFKESQLENLHIGQAATLYADVYGDDVVYHGHIVGFAAGSGSAFALLPAQNASGNWIKIVQRLPVRIALDPTELQQHPLRVGLSIAVSIDVHDRSGPLLASQVRSTALPTQDSIANDPAIQERIDKIIAANAGQETQLTGNHSP